MCMFYPASYWSNAASHTNNCIEVLIGSTPVGFMMNGNTGVMIFLAITGAGTYWLSKAEKTKIVNSSINRVFKIVIPMLLSTTIIWLIIKFNCCFFDKALIKTQSIWYEGYINNFDLYINIFSDFFSQCAIYNGPLWPMRYYLIGFYLALFVCLISIEDRRRYFATGTIIILLLLKEYYLIPTMAGIIVAEKSEIIKNKKVNCLNEVIIFLIAIYLGGVPTGMKSDYTFYKYLPIDSVFFKANGFYIQFYHMISAVLLLYLTLNSNMAKKILNANVLQYIGRYSMALFYIHFAVLISLSSFMFLNLPIEGYNLRVAITILLSLIIMMIIAISFNYVNNKIVSGVCTINKFLSYVRF